MVLRELVTILGFKADDKALVSYESEMAKLKKSMLAIVGVATAVGTALFTVANSAAKAGDELDKTLKLVGLTAKQFQLLRGAGELSGITPELLTTSLEIFNRNIGMARQGMQMSLKPFQTLGVSLRDSNGNLKTTYQLTLDVADAFSKLKNTADKTAVSQEMYGRGGLSLINLLDGGASSIKELMGEFEKYTYLIDDKAIKSSAKFRDQLFLMETAIKGVKNEIGIVLIPGINAIIKKILEWYVANKKLVDQDIKKTIDSIATAFKWLGYILDTIISAANEVVSVFQSLIDNLTPLESKIIKITGIVIALSIAFNAIPLSIAAIILVLDDINVYMKGGDSLIGRFAKSHPKLLSALKETFKAIKFILYDSIIHPLEIIWRLLKEIDKMLGNLSEFVDLFKGINKIVQTAGGAQQAYLGQAGFSTTAFAGASMPTNKNMNVNTTIHMTVPAGTASAQQDYLKQSAANIFDTMFTDELNKTLISFQRLEQ